jgi:hypothetical protein
MERGILGMQYVMSYEMLTPTSTLTPKKTIRHPIIKILPSTNLSEVNLVHTLQNVNLNFPSKEIESTESIPKNPLQHQQCEKKIFDLRVLESPRLGVG